MGTTGVLVWVKAAGGMTAVGAAAGWLPCPAGASWIDNRGCPSRSGCFSTWPLNVSLARRAEAGIIAFGQSRRATSQTVTAAPCGSDRSATKIASLSTRGFDCASRTSSARLTPTAAAAPATNAAAKTVMARGLCDRV